MIRPASSTSTTASRKTEHASSQGRTTGAVRRSDIGLSPSRLQQRLERPERRQPGAAVGQRVEGDARQRLAEDALDLLEVDELDHVGGEREARVLAEPDHRDVGAPRAQLLERLAEGPPVARRDDHVLQVAFVGAELDVAEHVVVDIGIFGRLGFGEYGEADVAQRLHPRPHDLGAARHDVGEHAGLGDGVLAREVEQPAADRVEARPERRGRAGAEQRAEAHVHVGGVPHQQHARLGAGGGRHAADPTGGGVITRIRADGRDRAARRHSHGTGRRRGPGGGRAAARRRAGAGAHGAHRGSTAPQRARHLPRRVRVPAGRRGVRVRVQQLRRLRRGGGCRHRLPATGAAGRRARRGGGGAGALGSVGALRRHRAGGGRGGGRVPRTGPPGARATRAGGVRPQVAAGCSSSRSACRSAVSWCSGP